MQDLAPELKAKLGKAKAEHGGERKSSRQQSQNRRNWASAFEDQEASNEPSKRCATPVTRQTHEELQSWILCDQCGKWRTTTAAIARSVEAGGPASKWSCGLLRPGATCRTSASDWGTVVRRAATVNRLAHLGCPISELAPRQACANGLPSASNTWAAQDSSPTPWLEYVPGRDKLVQADQLAAGLQAWDAASGEHILSTSRVSSEAIAHCSPFILRALELFGAGMLPLVVDGRASAGPVDLKAFLGQVNTPAWSE
ncbi:hypothetical protein WJX84_001720 [Apatococcus fuscideae]|uniref:CW-type domain-containing protein n=1 Tax=Apatococcus fuscideae TaxID=2026836 RepID=A0AAW1SJI0_9CHLO